MKANEAPKEVYLLPDERNPDGLSICWYEAPYRTGAIEYTRTDVFISKAAKWLSEIHRVCDITDENGYRIELRELIARFGKYMED